MKILVTVGTTPFESLVKAVDQQLSQSHHLTSQISNGVYIPQHHDYFRFSNEIDTYYSDADLIISHGGAGSVFHILELGKKLVIVPNLERVDTHQIDICEFMQKNYHAMVCSDVENLSQIVEKALITDFLPYTADEFTGQIPIREYLGLNNTDG